MQAWVSNLVQIEKNGEYEEQGGTIPVNKSKKHLLPADECYKSIFATKNLRMYLVVRVWSIWFGFQ